MDVDAVAGVRRVEQRQEARAQCHAGGRSRAPPPASRRCGRLPPGPRRRHGDLELVGRELGEEALGLHAGLRQSAAITRAANGSARRMRLQREGQRRARRSASSWNSCSKLASSRAPSCCSSASAPRAESAADSTPTGGRRSRRCRRAGTRRDRDSRVQAHPRGRVGDQAQVARGAERVGFRERAEWRQRVVGGHPADAAGEVGGELVGRKTERPRTIAPRSQQTSATSSASLTSPTTVPLSQIASRRPSPAAARADALGVLAETTTTMQPPGGHVAPLDRRGQQLARLQMHAPVARARGRCRRAHTGCRAGPSTRPTTQAKCPTFQSGAGPSARRRGGREELADARARAPQVMRWRGSRSG